METIILIVLVVLVVLLLISRSRTVWGLIVNGVIGVILLFLTNLFLEDDIPINHRRSSRMIDYPGVSHIRDSFLGS